MSARRGPAQARKGREVITGQQIKAADLQLWKLLKKGSSILRAEVPEQLAQLVWRNIRAGATTSRAILRQACKCATQFSCAVSLGLLVTGAAVGTPPRNS